MLIRSFSNPSLQKLLLLIGIFALPSCLSQAGNGKTVESISIRYVGNPTVSEDRILARMSIKKGDVVSLPQIDADTKSIFASGEVANVQILSNEVKGGRNGEVELIVIIEGQPLYGGSKFQGNTVFTTNQLSKHVQMTENRLLDESTIRATRQKILQAYEKKGYPETKVSYVLTPPNPKNYATVIFTIEEGNQGVLRRVSFTGNQSIPPEQLKEVMKQKERGLQNLFKGAGFTDSESVAADVQLIEDFYRENGFFEARVTRVKKIAVDTKFNDLVIVIDEGKPFNVTKIQVSGMNALPNKDEITARLKTGNNKKFSDEDLRNDIQMIIDEYRSRGYLDVTVEPYIQHVTPK